MATAFNESYYLQYKLAQLTKRGEHYTEDSLKAAIEKAGMTVEEHYNKYATTEGTSANPYFNTTEYLEAKLAQLNSTQEGGHSWTMSQLMDALKAAGLTAEEHYQKWGCKETDADGKLINPSNAFDANAYVAAKLYQLQHSSDAAEAAEWAGKTAMDVLNAITAHRMSPVSHYERYGSKEANADNVAMVQTVPVVDRVANDPLRAIAEDNVPSNYNKSTTAPASVSTGHVVTKPADMGGLADESVSPEVTNPDSPVATPSDPEYVEVPGDGITDTNSNPVVLVEATVTDANGNEVKVAQYGVETSNGNVQPVTDNGTVDRSADPIQTTSTANGVTTTSVNVTDGENTIKETSTEQADGAKTTSTEATLSDGSTVKGTAETTVANGVATTETTATVTKADGTSVTTEATVVESGNRTTTEGTTTTKDSDGKVTGTTESTVVETANANGSTTVKTDATVKDANGKTVETVSETATTTKASDGTTTTTTRGTSTDANGNVTKTNETVIANRDAATGTTTTDTAAKTTNPDGSTVTSQNTETVAKASDGTTTTQSTGTTTTKDASGNTSSVATEATKVENPDGSGTETATTTATAADGSTVETTSSSATTVAEDGTKTTETKTEAVAKDADGATTSTTTTEAKTTENTDGTSKTETTAVTENADGSKEEVKTSETTNADGSSEKTTETTTTDASGKSETSTETEKTDADGNTSTDSGSSSTDSGSDTPTPTPADTTKPTATVTFDDTSNTFTVTFSEKVSLVDGKALDDSTVSLSDGTKTVDLTDAEISDLSDGTTFTVKVAKLAAGNYTLSVKEGTVKDAAGNTNAEITSDSLENTESGGGEEPATGPTFGAESVTLDEAKLADGSGTGSGSATGTITVQNAEKLYVGTDEVTSTGILLDASGKVTTSESEGVVKVAYDSGDLTYTLVKASSATSISVPLSTASGEDAVKTITVAITDDNPTATAVDSIADSLTTSKDPITLATVKLSADDPTGNLNNWTITATKDGAEVSDISTIGTLSIENGKLLLTKADTLGEGEYKFSIIAKDGDTAGTPEAVTASFKVTAPEAGTVTFSKTAVTLDESQIANAGSAGKTDGTVTDTVKVGVQGSDAPSTLYYLANDVATAIPAGGLFIKGDGTLATENSDSSAAVQLTYSGGTLTYTLLKGSALETKEVSFTNEENGTEAKGTVTLTVTDDAPVATAATVTEVKAGSTDAITIATGAAYGADGAGDSPITIKSVTLDGTALVEGSEGSIAKDESGNVTWTPAAALAAGKYVVTYTLKDADADTDGGADFSTTFTVSGATTSTATEAAVGTDGALSITSDIKTKAVIDFTAAGTATVQVDELTATEALTGIKSFAAASGVTYEIKATETDAAVAGAGEAFSITGASDKVSVTLGSGADNVSITNTAADSVANVIGSLGANDAVAGSFGVFANAEATTASLTVTNGKITATADAAWAVEGTEAKSAFAGAMAASVTVNNDTNAVDLSEATGISTLALGTGKAVVSAAQYTGDEKIATITGSAGAEIHFSTKVGTNTAALELNSSLAGVEHVLGGASEDANYVASSNAADKIACGDATDHIIFGAKDEGDTITGFEAGADGDVINLSAFLGVNFSETGNVVDGNSGTADAKVALDSKVAYIKTAAADVDAAKTAVQALDENATLTASTGKFVLLAKDDADEAKAVNMFYVTAGESGLTDATVSLVGTFSGIDNASSFVDANFESVTA